MSAGRGFAQLSQLLLHFTSDVSLKYSKINFLLHILDIRIGYHMRDEVISVLSLEGAILSRVSAANEGQNMIS